MLKSIVTSTEASVCRESEIQRNFTTVLQNIPEMNHNINRQIQKYEDRQTMSKRFAAQIQSR